MSAVFDPDPAAAALAELTEDRRQISELPEALRPSTLREGYDIQDRVIARLNDRPVGWKLGVGSPAALRKAKLARPLIGRLLRSRVHGIDEDIRLPRSGAVTVELEIAFVLAKDIAAGTRLEHPLDAVAETYVAFEFVRSRFTDRRTVGWPSYVADNVGLEAFTLGHSLATEQFERAMASARVERNGVEVATSLNGDDRTDPVQSLRFLIEHAGERATVLRRGEIVTTGAVAAPFDIARDRCRIEARYLDQALAVNVAFDA